jgi:hypothetical protein
MTAVNERTIRALVEAGAVKKVLIIADGATMHVNIVTQTGTVTATTLRGSIKTWSSLDSSAKWVRNLGIGLAVLEISKWLLGQKREYLIKGIQKGRSHKITFAGDELR